MSRKLAILACPSSLLLTLGLSLWIDLFFSFTREEQIVNKEALLHGAKVGKHVLGDAGSVSHHTAAAELNPMGSQIVIST